MKFVDAFFIEPDILRVRLSYFCRKDYTVYHIPFLIDVISKHWHGQVIRFFGDDGENLNISGALAVIQEIQNILEIPNDKIEFETLFPVSDRYRHVPLPTADAFKKVKNFLNLPVTHNIDQARFVGMLNSSRWGLYRYLLMYNLDQCFADDFYFTYNYTWEQTELQFQKFEAFYQEEINWAHNKIFNSSDIDCLPKQTVLNWQNATECYQSTANLYQIEVIAETDEFQNCWFTEKTARALATGKPFVLLSGKHSLDELKKLGYQTFESCLDESYDRALSPRYRIDGIVSSLKQLHASPNKKQIINEMYKIAAHNQQHYLNNNQ